MSFSINVVIFTISLPKLALLWANRNHLWEW